MSSLEKEYYEASRFWSEGVLEDQNNLDRIDRTVKMIPDEVKTLLDAGCGNGLFLNTLLEKRPHIRTLGFDRSEEALRYVQAEKRIGDMSALDFPSGSFDCVSCLEVIEHLPVSVYDTALKELARVSGKYLLISVPHNEDLSEAWTQCPQCLSIFNANLHFRSYSKQVFTSLFERYGYRNIRVELCGRSERFRGHSLYQKIFYPRSYRQWISPLCPICGYKEKAPDPPPAYDIHSASMFSLIKSIPKAVWPKEERFYWIIGLFEKRHNG